MTPDRAWVPVLPEEEPAWVCAECGSFFGRRDAGVCCWHPDTCGVCGRETLVTEPRDYGGLRGYVEEYRTSKREKWKPAAALEPWEWLILRDDTEFRIRRDVDAQKRN